MEVVSKVETSCRHVKNNRFYALAKFPFPCFVCASTLLETIQLYMCATFCVPRFLYVRRVTLGEWTSAMLPLFCATFQHWCVPLSHSIFVPYDFGVIENCAHRTLHFHHHGCVCVNTFLCLVGRASRHLCHLFSATLLLWRAVFCLCLCAIPLCLRVCAFCFCDYNVWYGNMVWKRGMVLCTIYKRVLWYPCKDKSGTSDFHIAESGTQGVP